MESNFKELEKQLTNLKNELAAYKSDMRDTVQQLDRRVTLLENRMVGSPKR